MSNIEKSEETTNIIGAMQFFGSLYLAYLFILVLQLVLINWLHAFNVLLMILSIAVSYLIFILPVLFVFYLLYKVFICIKNMNIKLFNKGMFTIGASIFVIFLTCVIHPFVLQYFQENLFSRAF